MKEYANGGCKAKEQYFSPSLCRRGMANECTFGLLNMRFEALRHILRHYGHIDKPELPPLHKLCMFFFLLYGETCKETVDRVMTAMQFDQEYQPPKQYNCYQTDCNEAKGKRGGYKMS